MRTRIGVLVTAAWVIFLLVLMSMRSEDLGTMKLQDWGTFLGGVTGPVAFLWLILGYLQQGEELRLNTDALRLQQEELRHQVEETAQLVLHTETQARANLEALALQRERDEQERRAKISAAQPYFSYAGSNTSAVAATMKFRNTGGRARVQNISSPQTNNVVIDPRHVIEAGFEGTLYYEGISTFPAEINIEYLDDFGERRAVRLVLLTNGSFVQSVDPPESRQGTAG